MKFIKAILFLTVVAAPFAQAAEVICTGMITTLMVDHVGCKDDSGKKQIAFKITGTDNWFCNNSDAASSLILSSKLSAKEVKVYMTDAGGATCQVHANYLKPNYITLK